MSHCMIVAKPEEREKLRAVVAAQIHETLSLIAACLFEEGPCGVDDEWPCARLTRYDFASRFVLGWEGCLKYPRDGARKRGIIKNCIIRSMTKVFDNLRAGKSSTRRSIARSVSPDGAAFHAGLSSAAFL
jgi:hypothetical protein